MINSKELLQQDFYATNILDNFQSLLFPINVYLSSIFPTLSAKMLKHSLIKIKKNKNLIFFVASYAKNLLKNNFYNEFELLYKAVNDNAIRGFLGTLIRFNHSDFIDKLGNLMKECTDDQSNAQMQAHSCYNYANFLSNRGEFKEALHFYNLARKYGAFYDDLDYWNAEIGAVLFNLRMYSKASQFYCKALEADFFKENKHKLILVIADCEFHKKNFNHSTNLYRNCLSNVKSLELFSLLVLKIFVSEVMSDFEKKDLSNIRKTFSEHAEGKEYLQSIEELANNPLSNIAWFNAGIYSQNNQDYEEALSNMLCAALSSTRDVEAWVHCLIYAWNLKKMEEFNCILMAMRHVYGSSLNSVILNTIHSLAIIDSSTGVDMREVFMKILSYIENETSNNQAGREEESREQISKKIENFFKDQIQ